MVQKSISQVSLCSSGLALGNNGEIGLVN